MSYSQIDPVLDRWAADQDLTVMTLYKDCEVRSIDLAGEEGCRFQLWVDPPEQAGKVCVHIWDYRKRRADYESELEDLVDCLDEALRTVSRWAG